MAKQFRHILTVHTGPMKSAKTLHLIQTYVHAQTAKRNMQAFRPKADTRQLEPVICTRFGNVCVPATLVESSTDLFNQVREETKLVLIDEGQFFDDGLTHVVRQLLLRVDVCIAGLDLDYRGEPFGVMPQLLALADEVHKYSSICDVCGASARFTQRLTKGKPSRAKEPQLVAEGSEADITYQTRCHVCYRAPR